MTLLGYQSISQKINELRNLLIEKLYNCGINKSTDNSFTELIEAVGEIRAVEVDNVNNVRPSHMPNIDNSNIVNFHITLYSRIRYYMRLLGYFLVLKGVSRTKVNEQTDLKGLIELIDYINVIKESQLTLILDNFNEIQYYGTNINIEYTLTDNSGNNITEGEITIKDDKGIVYDSIEVGNTITITPLNISQKNNNTYEPQTFTITYTGTEKYLPSEPQQVNIKILPSKINVTLALTNINTRSKYFNNAHIGYESDKWDLTVLTTNHRGQLLANIPFRLEIDDTILEEYAQSNEDGFYRLEQYDEEENPISLNIQEVGEHIIRCTTLAEETEKMINSYIEYDVAIKYNVLQQPINEDNIHSNFYTEYVGKNNYTYKINVVDEDSGEITHQYDGYSVLLSSFKSEENYTETDIILNDEMGYTYPTLQNIAVITIINGQATYTTSNSFNVGKINLIWELQDDNCIHTAISYINTLSNFILPKEGIIFLNNEPEIIYAPEGRRQANNIVNCNAIYTIKDETDYYENNITLTTNEQGVLDLTNILKYKSIGNHRLTLKSTNNINETCIYEYEIRKPFDIELINYDKKVQAQYKITLYTEEYEYDFDIINNNQSIDDSQYNISIVEGSIEENKPTYKTLILTIPISEYTDGTNTLSFTMNNYTEETTFKLINNIFTLLTNNVNIGNDVIQIQCNDDGVSNIEINSDFIIVNNIEYDNNIFTVDADFQKGGEIFFDVIDDRLSYETFSIIVNKANLEPDVYATMSVKNPEDVRTRENRIAYIDKDKIFVSFSIDHDLLNDLTITYLIKQGNNELHTQSFTHPITDENFKFNMPTLMPGEYQMEFIFTGDDNYQPFDKIVNFEILKSEPTHNITTQHTVYTETIQQTTPSLTNANNSHLVLYNSNNDIFKKGEYTKTYLAVTTTGLPNGAKLYLIDNNSNQLYSPYDTNGNDITTQCYITVGETDIIPLPAQFNNSLSSYTDFEAGIYYWKLKFEGDEYYIEKQIPITIKIDDFNIWNIQTPIIYPNDDIKVQVYTYAHTFPEDINSSLLTNNAYYANNIITYPNSDIIDLSIGGHTQIINQQTQYPLNYEVKNPIYFLKSAQTIDDEKINTRYLVSPTEYHKIGFKIYDDCTLTTNLSAEDIQLSINGATVNSQSGNISSNGILKNVSNLPPDTYECICTAKLNNNHTYTCSGSFEVTTQNCSLSLKFRYDEEKYSLTLSYQYMNTPISNALIGLIDLTTHSLVATAITDNNGSAYWDVNSGAYKAVAINSKGEYILESNILDFNNIYSIITDVYIDEDGDLIVEDISSIEISNHTVNTEIEVNQQGNLVMTSLSLMDLDKDSNILTSIYHSNGKIIADSVLLSEINDNESIIDYLLSDNGKLYANTTPLTNITDIEVVTDIDMDDNDDLSVTQEQYIYLDDIDKAISDINYNDEDSELITKTVGDIKEENNN